MTQGKDDPSKTIVIANYNNGSPKHGPNLRGYYVAKYLVQKGYTVHIFCSSYFHKWTELPEVTGEVNDGMIAGAHYHWIKTRPYKGLLGRIWSFQQFAAKLPNSIRQKVPAMKALICSSPPPTLAPTCHRIAKEYNARFIFEVRDIWPLAITAMGKSKLNPYIMYLGWAEKYACKHADLLVSALPCAEEYMRTRGLPEGRYYNIENGAESGDPKKIDEAEIPSLHKETLKRKVPFRIGYSGAFDRDNDPMSLIRAADYFKEHDIEIVLVGKGVRENQLRQAASGKSNVKILPAVRSEQVPWILSHFDACYMGLRDKQINMYGVSMAKIFEYLRAAKPIVSAVKAGNDIIGAANCGITVTPEASKEIADAVISLSKLDPSERAAMGQRGSQYMNDHHSYEVLVERWINAINGTINE